MIDTHNILFVLTAWPQMVCGRCGNKLINHRLEIFAHHSECTLENFTPLVPQKGGQMTCEEDAK